MQKRLNPIREIKHKRNLENKNRWCLTCYPTSSLALSAKMSLNKFEAFWAQSCFLNDDNPIESWLQLKEQQEIYVSYLNKTEHLHFKGPNIDLILNTKDRKWINSDGRRNMPSGEIFTSPIETSANGWVQVTFPSRYFSTLFKGIYLEFKNGKVINFDTKLNSKKFKKILDIPGASSIGEIAIGTNKNIQTLTHNTLFDEKISGTMHFALGSSYPETGGKNKSSIHWDLISSMNSQSEILADGKCIYKNGVFLI